jgi:predicted porin
MKKSLIALAVLVASGAAMAQSSVTIYGIADAVIHKDKNVSTQLTGSGGLSTSRIGFRGTEDLGGGLSANFQLEQGLNLSSGSGGTFNRQSWVGLSGGFGEIRLGNTPTPYDDVATASGLGFDSNVFDSSDIMFTQDAYTSRPGSVIYYATPDFGGFSAAVSYSLNANKQDYTSLRLGYAAGPLAVNVAYQDESDANNEKYTVLNGAYDFGAFKLLAAYGTLSVADTDEYSIAVEVPLGAAMTVSLGYAATDTTGQTKATGFSGAVTYGLSKRTTLYAGFRNDKGTGFGSTVVDSRYGVGIRHAF